MRVLVLGAGFGGLEPTTTLSEELGDAADVTLVDQVQRWFGRAWPDVDEPVS